MWRVKTHVILFQGESGPEGQRGLLGEQGKKGSKVETILFQELVSLPENNNFI